MPNPQKKPKFNTNKIIVKNQELFETTNMKGQQKRGANLPHLIVDNFVES